MRIETSFLFSCVEVFVNSNLREQGIELGPGEDLPSYESFVRIKQHEGEKVICRWTDLNV